MGLSPWGGANFDLSQRRWRKKDELTLVSRSAKQPGQTLTVDLCLVPPEHLVAEKLLTVSGSSGRLVISALPAETAKPSSPGQVFAEERLDYTEVMLQFVAASRDADGLAPAASETHAADEKSTLKAQKQGLQREADELRVARRQQRTQR